MPQYGPQLQEDFTLAEYVVQFSFVSFVEDTVQLPIDLPTDNLYKFSAIAGLLLMALGVTGYFTAFAATNHALRSIEFTTDSLEFELTYIRERKREADLLIDRTKKLLQRRSHNTFDFFDKATALTDSITRDVHDLKLVSIRQRHALAIATDLSKQATLTVITCVWSLMIGLALATIGFHQWYYKIQRHQDAAVAQMGLSAKSSAIDERHS